MSNGYVNISRDIFSDPVVCKDAVTLGVVMWLIKEAAYVEHKVLFGNEIIILQPGQLVTGRKSMSEQLMISDSKVQRTLDALESEQLIEQQTNSRGRLITLLFWNSKNKSEQPTEQQMNSQRTASEQQLNSKVNTTEIKINKDIKEIKERGVSKDTPRKKSQTSIVEDSELPDDLKPKVLEWLKYKSEKNQGYKETGLRALITQVCKYANDLGADVVRDRIDAAMAAGWQGMNLDKLNARAAPRAAPMGSYDPDLQRQAEENFRRMMEERNAVHSW